MQSLRDGVVNRFEIGYAGCATAFELLVDMLLEVRVRTGEAILMKRSGLSIWPPQLQEIIEQIAGIVVEGQLAHRA